MSFETLLEWASKEIRLVWQSDALQRISRSGELSDNDLSELQRYIEVSQGLSKEDLPKLSPLSKDHITDITDSTPKTILGALGPVKNVDRLEPDQPPLKFASNGVTLIYGPNGSGKSGYCRITKYLCLTHAKGTIKGNVYNDTTESIANVKIRFRVGDENHEECIELHPEENSSPPELARIFVFDTASARIYVDKNRKIEFLPYELDLLNKLHIAVKKMEEKFKIRANELDRQLNSYPGLLGGFSQGTEVSKTLEKLSVNVSPEEIPTKEEIENLGSWKDEDQQNLDLLLEQLKEDPGELIRSRNDVLQSLRLVRDEINQLEKIIGNVAIKDLLARHKDKLELTKLATGNASELFEGEPIPTIGSETWRRLIHAAREFVLEIFPSAEPPIISTGDRCVLCQQELSAEASKRLKAFEEFMDRKITTEAEIAEKTFNELVSKLLNFTIKSGDNVSTILSRFGTLSKNSKEFKHEVSDYFDTANERLDFLKDIMKKQDYKKISELVSLPKSPLDRIQNYKLEIEEECKGLEILANNDKVYQKYEQKAKEMKDRKAFSADVESFIERRNKLEEKSKLIECIKLCQTKPITTQITRRRKELLTPSLRKALNEELKTLDLSYIPLSLNDRSSSGDSLVGVALSASQKVTNNSEILSEGEQRGLALACFFAELREIGGNHSIIIDDPVSSLDHSRMELVAKRLANEASNGRQVIVFTHNILFHNYLNVESKRHNVACHNEWISNPNGNHFGIIDQSQKPGQMKKVTEKIDDIKNKKEELKSSNYDPKNEKFRGQIISLYESMRSTWERIIEEILFNETVQRFRPEIRTQNLESAPFIRSEDYPKIYNGMKRCSTILHDQPSEIQEVLPGEDQISDDINALEDFFSCTRNRRKELRRDSEYSKGIEPKFI